jgi:hypothetical protein
VIQIEYFFMIVMGALILGLAFFSIDRKLEREARDSRIIDYCKRLDKVFIERHGDSIICLRRTDTGSIEQMFAL